MVEVRDDEAKYIVRQERHEVATRPAGQLPHKISQGRRPVAANGPRTSLPRYLVK